MAMLLRILIVEDDESQVLLIVRLLEKEGYELYYYWVDTKEKYLQALIEKKWDVIISDYSMPSFNGEDALKIYNEMGLDIPFVLMSGTVGEEIAVRMLKSGASDYIMKNKLGLLIPSIHNELKRYAYKQEQKKVEEELRIAQSIIKESPVILWKWAPYPAKDVLYVSDNISRLGYNKEDFIDGKISYESIIHPEDIPINSALRDKYFAEKQDYYEMRYRILSKDGDVHWIIDQTTIVRNNKGDIEYSQGLIIDITETYLTQRALDESELRLKTIVENTPVGIDLLDMQGNFIEVNRAFCELTGYSQEELLSMNFRDITVPDDLPENERLIADLLAGRLKSIDYIKRYRRKNGQIIWVQVFSNIFRDASGKPKYFVTQVQDITSRKQAEQEIYNAKVKAEESNRVKTALLANMSHEFRTPMSGILGFAHLIKQSDANEEVKEMANLIEQSGKRLLQTLESIMLLAQLEVEDFAAHLNHVPISMGAFLKVLTDNYLTAANQKQLEFLLDIKDDLVLYQDENLLKNALKQVIDNAIKFTEKGSVTITLQQRIINHEVWAEIKVTDTGIGISDSHRDLIFQEFRQLSVGYDRRYEGTGIGLTITKKIIDLFKGKIEVQGYINKGTTVIISIPLCQTKEIKEKEKPEIFLHKEILPFNHVLVVEDNIVNTKLIVKYLSVCKEKFGLCQEIDCATTGEEAVTMAKKKHYDIILMDINLGPGIDGLTATQRIRKIAGYEKTPIVAVTGYTMVGDKERLLAGGCSHYLGKPFGQDDILNIFRDITKESAS